MQIAFRFAAAQVNNNNQAISAKKSLLAPIPVAGPQYRLYLTKSPRLYVEGNLFGMYFFGYGNFISTADDLGVTLTKHFSVNAGYQLGSRLNVNVDSKNDRLGLSLTQKGADRGGRGFVLVLHTLVSSRILIACFPELGMLQWGNCG